MLKNINDKQWEWVGRLAACAVICALLYWLLGSVGILYGLAFAAFAVLSELITKMLRPAESKPEVESK